ncbi:MAG TPA: ATP-binding protein, partial [Campylobacterales bacterium]|nr:ATP-binding protein [Campylobacterales bacterium]
SAVEQTLVIMKPMLVGNSIEINYKEDDNYLVRLYKNEFEQALIILIQNAKDALMEKRTQSAKIDITAIRKEINKIEITVTDNAGGIQEEIIDKIFEPYFTTKDDNKGTGIGLYLAKEIIERRMNGKLYAKNGEFGAVFVIELET